VRGEAKRDTRYSGFVTQSLQLSGVTTVERRGEERGGEERRGERGECCVIGNLVTQINLTYSERV
jgi:hypothetical protein